MNRKKVLNGLTNSNLSMKYFYRLYYNNIQKYWNDEPYISPQEELITKANGRHVDMEKLEMLDKKEDDRPGVREWRNKQEIMKTFLNIFISDYLKIWFKTVFFCINNA